MALLRVLPVLLGSKTCRKYGLGAVVAERREALIFLEENCRQCGRCRLGRQL